MILVRLIILLSLISQRISFAAAPESEDSTLYTTSADKIVHRNCDNSQFVTQHAGHVAGITKHNNTLSIDCNDGYSVNGTKDADKFDIKCVDGIFEMVDDKKSGCSPLCDAQNLVDDNITISGENTKSSRYIYPGLDAIATCPDGQVTPGNAPSFKVTCLSGGDYASSDNLEMKCIDRKGSCLAPTGINNGCADMFGKIDLAFLRCPADEAQKIPNLIGNAYSVEFDDGTVILGKDMPSTLPVTITYTNVKNRVYAKDIIRQYSTYDNSIIGTIPNDSGMPIDSITYGSVNGDVRKYDIFNDLITCGLSSYGPGVAVNSVGFSFPEPRITINSTCDLFNVSHNNIYMDTLDSYNSQIPNRLITSVSPRYITIHPTKASASPTYYPAGYVLSGKTCQNGMWK